MKRGSKPIVNAMLVCDKVITEAGTNKKSLIGVFGNINVFKFPCIHHFLSVYIKFTDANGQYKFRLELVDLEKDTPVGKSEIPKDVNVNNPLETHDLVFNLAGIRFTHPGKYEFRIFANDEVFGQKTFIAHEAKSVKPNHPER